MLQKNYNNNYSSKYTWIRKKAAHELGLGSSLHIDVGSTAKSNQGRIVRYLCDTTEELRAQMYCLKRNQGKLTIHVTQKIVHWAKTDNVPVIVVGGSKSGKTFHKMLSDREQKDLEEELVKFSGSALVSVKGGTAKHKGASVPWEWGIKCGLCENVTQVSVDRATKGRIQRFRRGKEFENLKTSCRKIIFYAIDGAPQGNSKSHFHAGFCVQITPQNV